MPATARVEAEATAVIADRTGCASCTTSSNVEIPLANSRLPFRSRRQRSHGTPAPRVEGGLPRRVSRRSSKLGEFANDIASFDGQGSRHPCGWSVRGADGICTVQIREDRAVSLTASPPRPPVAQCRLPRTGWRRTRSAVRIGIGGHLAMPPLPHHRAYGSVPRRFGGLGFGERVHGDQAQRAKVSLVESPVHRARQTVARQPGWPVRDMSGWPVGRVESRA